MLSEIDHESKQELFIVNKTDTVPTMHMCEQTRNLYHTYVSWDFLKLSLDKTKFREQSQNMCMVTYMRWPIYSVIINIVPVLWLP